MSARSVHDALADRLLAHEVGDEQPHHALVLRAAGRRPACAPTRAAPRGPCRSACRRSARASCRAPCAPRDSRAARAAWARRSTGSPPPSRRSGPGSPSGAGRTGPAPPRPTSAEDHVGEKASAHRLTSLWFIGYNVWITACDSERWTSPCTTRSSSARAAPAPPRRCCSRARASACCSSTGPASRATPSRPTTSTSRASPASSAGACCDTVVAPNCPPIRDYTLDVGPFALHGLAAAGRRVADAYSRAPQVSTRSCVDGGRRGGRGGARALLRRGARDRRRARHRHPRPHRRWRDGDRARPHRHRRRRAEFGRRPQRRRAALRRDARADLRVLQLLERRREDGVELYPRPGRDDRRRADQRRAGRDHRLLAARAVRRASAPTSRGSFRGLELAPGLAERVRAGSARARFRGTDRCRTSSAGPTATAGRSSATPATTRTRSSPWASPTRSATRSCWPER